jgi:hypothetical protein
VFPVLETVAIPIRKDLELKDLVANLLVPEKSLFANVAHIFTQV